MIAFIVIGVVVAWLLGGAHSHRRHYRRTGLHPDLYYTYGRGLYGSIKVGGWRIGHRL